MYEKQDDESILLHQDCKRLLRRHSKKLIIDEVLEKLFNEKNIINNKNNENNKNNKNNENKNKKFIEYILILLCCDKSL